MRISRIHVDAHLAVGATVTLSGQRSHYVSHVLRLNTGHQLIVFNGRENHDYRAEINIKGKLVYATLLDKFPGNTDAVLHIHLLQALGKADNIDLIVQKATELGVKQFTFFNAERTQSPLKSVRLEKKLIHWNGIAISACEQSGRNMLPHITFVPQGLRDTLQQLSAPIQGIVFDFSPNKLPEVCSAFKPSHGICLLVGPEGGLTQNEINQALEAGFQDCSLGPRVLRMETAAIAATALIQHHLGDI